MIILLYGNDTFRSRDRLHTLRAAFREKHDPTGVNIVRVDGETLKASTLMSHLTAQGFLAARRFLAVENFLSLGRAAEQAAALAVFASPSFATENILVLWESGEPDSRKKKNDSSAKLWQTLSAMGKVEHFLPLEGAPLTKWYTQQIHARGGAIEKTALQHLIHLVGADLWQASSEIEKLIHFSGGQPISEATIDQLIAAPFDDTIFQLTDAIGQRDSATALKLLENQFLNGAEPLYLLRMLAWHVRNLIGVRSLLDEGANNPRTIARDLALHSFVAQKAIRQVASFSLDDLKSFYRGLLDIDRSIKSRPIDPRVLFTLLTVKLAQPSGRALAL